MKTNIAESSFIFFVTNNSGSSRNKGYTGVGRMVLLVVVARVVVVVVTKLVVILCMKYFAFVILFKSLWQIYEDGSTMKKTNTQKE